MDTSIEITAYGPGAERAVQAAMEVFRRVDREMNNYVASSRVSRVNASAGVSGVEVSAESFDVIRGALEMARRSGGAFDPTIGPLVTTWNIRRDATAFVPPSPEAIRKSRSLVDYRLVELQPGERTVKLLRPGMALDLGGAAKGYAAGRAAAIMREKGIRHGIINAGGNIVTVGDHPENRGWRIAIRDPRDPGAVLGTVSVAGQAVVTSGDYERFIMVGERRYHHLIDPHTGYPASNLRSVSIIGPDSFQADLLSTAVFVLGLKKGRELLGAFPGVEAMFVDLNGRLHFTPGFVAKYSWEPVQ